MSLELIDIKKTYRQGGAVSEVLRGVSSSFKRGEWYTVYGASGSGKTTLLNITGGLEKPGAGRVCLDGEDIYEMNDLRLSTWRNRRVGFVFQFFHLISDLNVEDNIKLPLRVRGAKADPDWLGEMAEILGIGSLLKRKPSTLSGGEQQRVAMARALINRPDYILADEPTGNLDNENSSRVIGLLRNLQEKSNAGIILATHERDLASTGDHVMSIRNGLLCEDNPDKGAD